MSAVDVDGLEVVGFNGTPQVECGRALPVVRRKADGMHGVLRFAGGGAAATWHDADEASEFAGAGRWTRLREPIPVPRSCVAGPGGHLTRQPMVVHAARVLLDVAGRAAWPPVFRGEPLLWRRLDHDADSVRAACGSDAMAEGLLDDWAVGLKGRFDALYHAGADRASLKRAADFMLCAARSRPSRWQAYLRYAVAQEPDRVRPTFDAFTRHEFPGVPWEGFLEQIKSLGEVLKAVPVRGPQPAAPSSPVTALPKLRGIAARRPLDLQPTAAA